MSWVGTAAHWLFSIFLVTSPLTSYLDTALSIRRRRSAAGFSVDVCGIMLVASMLRVNFWIGDRYNVALLLQSIVMLGVQCYLLDACLTYRAGGPSSGYLDVSVSKRPWQLWQWDDARTYWRFLAQFLAALCILQVLLGVHPFYVTLLGMVGLTIEATLPIPQFLQNMRTRSVDGVRLTMIGSWVFGDISKLFFFYLGSSTVSWQFKACAFVQMCFDFAIATQFYLWHDKPSADVHLGGTGQDYGEIRLGLARTTSSASSGGGRSAEDELRAQQPRGAPTLLPL
ncbi:hypothetical protein PYCC9005_000309 [Savitreella phatthalungensis]